MIIRGLGAIHDAAEDVEEDLRRHHIGQLVGAAPVALPDRVDYSSLVGPIPDQKASSACVGFAFATAIYLRSRIAGHPLTERPSAKAIYDIARLGDTHDWLADVGSRPRAAIDGMSTFGLVAESRWPLTAENVNEKPPLDVFRAGVGALLSGHYRIGGGDIATLARSSLSKGFPVFFAMPVDGAFLTLHDGSVYDGPIGEILGNHAMCLVGYEPGAFLVANSWGIDWGAGGFCRISDACLNERAFDVLVTTIIPEQVS
jgi:hypothetical protein